MRQILLILLILSGCRDVDQLRPVPPCEPVEETCNGYDDDCDGLVDEDSSVECSSICGSGRQLCVKGQLAVCNAQLPSDEVCDGKDNDCDGVVDNYEVIGVQPCYPGNSQDLLNGECRWGVRRCIGGTFVCQGAVTPVPEECNGKDDDCDGQVDDGTSAPLDLIFAVDYSGSMTSTISSLASVTAQWASRYSSRTDLRMALLGIPDDNGNHDGVVTVMSNLGSPQSLAALLQVHQSANGGGQEPSIDVVWLLSQSNNPLGINWTPGARRAVVVYTDEYPQSYLVPPITESSARSAAGSAGLRVFVFSSDPSWWQWGPKPFPSVTALEHELDEVVAKGSCQ